MKCALVAVVAVCLVASLCGDVSARDAKNRALRMQRPWSNEDLSAADAQQELSTLYEEAAADTYCLVWYNFETMSWQGWSRIDLTAQVDTFFHVDDFAGSGGGDFGMLLPIEGNRSMWCGARPYSGPYTCSWQKAPGYGNGWNQMLVTDPFWFVGAITLAFHCRYDTEPNHDFLSIEYDDGWGDWKSVAEYTGRADTVVSQFIPLTKSRTKLRFRFSSDGAWSDEDGLWNTDGACIVDSIGVSDYGYISNFENFESAPLGATHCGIWHSDVGGAFGMYSGLQSNLHEKDPCAYNLTTQVVFFIGSPYPSASYPGLFDTPYCLGGGGISAPCQNEVVCSPLIDLRRYSTLCNASQDADIPVGELLSLGGVLLQYNVYADLPIANLVFCQWYVRSIDEEGCIGPWMNDQTVDYFGEAYRSFHSISRNIGHLATSDRIQVALGVIDMCDAWYPEIGNCAEHTPTPYFDNVRLYRYESIGPQWSYRSLDLFQDNFPINAVPPWKTVRADAANDILAEGGAGIVPGDSIVIHCASYLGGGIDTMPNGYPAVFMHVNAHWIGAGSAPLGDVIHGAALQGTYGLWQSTDWGGWDIIQGDDARARGSVFANTYMFDLNDSLFVPGYCIEYYFTARDRNGAESAFPTQARSRGPYFEFTCLPTGRSDVLFVDDCSGIGSWNGVAEVTWNSVFRALMPSDSQPDRYDVNDPTAGVSNGLGSRANADILRSQYSIIIWDSGDLDRLTICDGTSESDKSNDCQLLVEWMEGAEHRCGLWICGDGIAQDLAGLASVQAATLMWFWCGVDFVDRSYYEVTGGNVAGGVTSPIITGDAAGIFLGCGGADEFYISGGCPVIKGFDCIEKTGFGKFALDFPRYFGQDFYCGIQSEQMNASSDTVRTMFMSFSYASVRDYVCLGIKFALAKKALSWLRNDGTTPSATLSRWERLTTATAPPGRFDHGIAYDSARGKVVIFGGCGGWYGPYLNDTWEWDGSSWKKILPETSPSPRLYNQMVYDAARHRVILFGGQDGSGVVLGDTWEYDGTNWTQLFPSRNPPARYFPGMAYDAARQRVVLFGGGDSGGGWLNDTWEWNGSNWTQRLPEHQPPPRWLPAGNGLAYDAARHVTVLFGGSQGGSGFLEDTWEWNGSDWIEKSPAHHPSARDAHALAYVPYAHVVLFGGNSSYTFMNDTWTWDGSDWTQAMLSVEPTQRHRHGMVYDALRDNLFMFGGWNFGDTGFGDSWELVPCDRSTGFKDGPAPPHFAAFVENYPNPFNPSTTIRYAIETPSRVTLKVYDVKGAVVKTLLDSAPKQPGLFSVTWDGTNDRGAKVASGIYFCRLAGGEKTRTFKMVLVR